ncbi:MAG: hypothetical protein HY721_13890 [Planctomycetes bacterium]|nr:hypothetical protein [Planctomycetota bacterium]
MSAQRTRGLALARARAAAGALAAALLPAAGSGCATPRREAWVRVDTDPETGWKVYTLGSEGPQGTLAARIVPEAGSNLFSLKVDGVELLKGPPSLKELPGTRYGTPILYPACGGEADGIACSLPWKVCPPREDERSRDPREAVLETCLEVKPGHPLYERLPREHRLDARFALGREGLRLDLKVTGSDAGPIPLEVAVGPRFLVLGERGQTFFEVPVRPREGLAWAAQDPKEPVSLARLTLDEALWELGAERSARFEARDKGIEVRVTTSEAFPRLALQTPRSKDHFCLESRTRPGEAHGLPAGGSGGAAAAGSITWRIKRTSRDARKE